GPAVWTVSARSAGALADAVRADAALLDEADPARLGALAAAAQTRRTHHPHRVAVVADTPADAAAKLRGWAPGGTAPAGVFGGAVGAAPPTVAVVFSGQGTQWPGMARDLFERDRTFRATAEELDGLLRPDWGRSLIEEIRRGDESVFRSDVGQPILFALQVGVYQLLSARGVRPVAVLGHSIGEVAAAVAAGALSLADAARVMVHRSRAQETTRGTGAMAAVGISEEAAGPLLAAFPGRLHVAAVNGPTDLTLAGAECAVRAAVEALAAKGTFAKLLPFPYAFHSPAMDPCREGFLAAVAGLRPRTGEIPFVSTVTGTELPGTALDAGYWWRNVREPVRFAAGVRAAAEIGAELFVEVGPHPGLLRYVHQTLGGAVVVPTLKRNEDGPRCLAETAAALHARGVRLDWAAGTRAAHADLPRHPWHRQPFWAEGEDSRRRRLAGPTHPLLGVREPGPVRQWESCLSAATFPYLPDHGFRTRAVLPAAAHLELMLAAASDGSFAEPVGLDDIHFDRALWTDHPVIVRTTLDATARRITVAARPVDDTDRGWEAFSRGARRVVDAATPPPDGRTPPADAATEPADDLYARFERAGHHYGPLFRTVRRLWTRGADVWAEVTLDPALHAEAGRYYMHPALLDGVLQAVLRATPVDEEREVMFLPLRLERVEWRRRAGPAVVCHIRNVHLQDVRWFADIDLFTPAGEWVATLTGCCCVTKPQDAHLTRGETKVYREEWAAAPRAAAAGDLPAACLVIDPAGTAGELVRLVSGADRWVGHQTDPADDLTTEFLARADGRGAVVVWATGAPDQESPSVDGVVARLEPLLRTAQALAAADAAGVTLWLVTAGATWGHDGGPAAPNLLTAPAAGLLRTAATELPKVTCRLLDLDPTTPEDHVELALGELWAPPPEDEIAYRGGQRFACRLRPTNPDTIGWRAVPAAGVAAYDLRTTEPGSLDGLAWVEADAAPPAPHEIEVDVRAVGLNFRDVLKALDIYPLAPTELRSFGDECAGVVRRVGSGVTDFRPGDEVVVISAHGFGNRIRVPAVLAAHKPGNLSFEQAATIPIAFLTADYCLADVARLAPGESVLIHAAAGGVGQAAVQVARRLGAEVFGTASPEKHDFLRSQGVKHVFHSRNLSFADGVREATGGRGVDVVLNSLSGDFIPRSLELLRPDGRFVEIGKKDIFQNTALDLHPFRNSVSFHAVDLAGVIARKPEWIGRRLRGLMDLFARGEYTPLPSTTFPAGRVGDAFRLMAQGKHRGKLVVATDSSSPPDRVLCHARPVVRPDASYLVTGGLSGLGLRTAEWLAAQGARWLVLAGRGGPKSDAARDALAALTARGVRVELAACDVTDPAAVAGLIQSPDPARPPLRGVAHSAMVLHDEPLARVDRAALEKVLAPKVAGAWNLHLATRALPLDWFVMYSSVATLLGSAAQASYVAANRFLDALAWHRRAAGLPALAVNWGPLAEVGVVADNAALARYLESVGLGLLPPDEVFRFLKFLLRRDVTTAGVVRVDWARVRETSPAARQSHRLGEVLEQRGEGGAQAAGSDALAAFLARPADDRPAFLLGHLRRALAAVLRADEAALDPASPLTSFGVDSLMAFEFKLRIDRDFRTDVPIDRLSAGTTLTELTALLVRQLTAEPAGDCPAGGSCAPSPPPAAAPAPCPVLAADPAPRDEYLRVLTRTSANGLLEGLRFDAAALLYVPDRVSTVGGVADDQLGGLFGHDPFVSHLYELPLGRIGVITLPVRGKDLMAPAGVAGLVRKAGDLARRRGASCVSLTGLIPSATDYGRAVREWFGDAGPRVTTGHATTTAAVVLNLQSMLEQAGRYPGWEHLAVLGLGSIGQSCLALLLDVLPHPRALTLCDVFAKQDEVTALARGLRERHGFRGPVQVLASDRGLPDGLYEATTILTAVSVPDVIDVDRLRPGTVVVDDSYPPGFPLDRAVRRAETAADLFFGNAGMVRLADPIRETVFLPPGAEQMVARFGPDAFVRELARDPRELTACILSALLTDRHEGFRATVGLADLPDLRSHYRGLTRLGITAARPQCGTYFMPDDLVRKFRTGFATRADGPVSAAP
ncbi:MAG: polyketide synthase family protein, partial [Gemmataceae bacterium]|nr:polyketide synthase family protein [Gemmataceae bacterium]